MLRIYGQGSRFCDGVSRRNFLQIGALGMGGLALPQLLQAEAQSGGRPTHKSVIMIYLPGGPPHQDTFDLKLDAPREVRGEFRAIPTNVAGIQICEHLPRLARIADKYALIRSMVGAKDDHSDFQCMTGRLLGGKPPQGGWPSLGAAISRLQGAAHSGVPPFVGLEPVMQHKPYNAATPGFLGSACSAFSPSGRGRADMSLNDITLDRLDNRKALLGGFDQFRRAADASGKMDGMDAFQRQAFGVLTSSKLASALDLGAESRGALERYGKGDPRPRGDAAPRLPEQFLLARRLVEAGARVVTVAFGFWDYHGNCFKTAREDLPMFDRGVSALIEDLHERGMSKDVSVVVWGEFGRTPRINKDAGRDHWPGVSCALLAGGGMRTGQVIGSTDRIGGEAADRPVHFGEVFATLYRNLGIDVNTATVTDLSGRPHYLVENGRQPIAELV